MEETPRDWIAEHVAVAVFKHLLQNVACGQDDLGWGPSSMFKFPLHGGTAEICHRAGRTLGDRVKYAKEVAEVDTERHQTSFVDGSGDNFDLVISTLPLDLLVKVLRPGDSQLSEAATLLRHNNLLVLAVGLKKKLNTTKCWVYFPSPHIPFYRATLFSNYSPFNVPNGDVERYDSLMCVASYPAGTSVNYDQMMVGTITGLIREGLLEAGDRDFAISPYIRHVSYSYPIPTLDGETALNIMLPAQLKRGIYSRGRFGAWKYEVGNTDHSVMMGVEAVGYILRLEPGRVVHANH